MSKLIRVTDLQGNPVDVMYLPNYRKVHRRYQRPLTEVRVGIVLDRSDKYLTWMPVFDEWFEEAMFCYCEVGAGGLPCIDRETCDDRRKV